MGRHPLTESNLEKGDDLHDFFNGLSNWNEMHGIDRRCASNPKFEQMVFLYY